MDADEDEVKAKLTDIFRKVFESDDLELSDATTAADVPGWDSMKMVMIVIAVEERFGIRASSREVDKLQCVGDFITLIKTKIV